MMPRQRFLAIWLGFSLLYVALASVGPGGLLSTGSWPQVNQHLLQVRAWRGDDIEITGPSGKAERVIAVRPRLDVTPYFRNWVISDPREKVLLTNLACGVRSDAREGQLRPVRYVPSDSLIARLQMERLECHIGSPLGPAFLLLPLHFLFGSALTTQWLGAILGGLAVALMDLLLGWALAAVRGSEATGRHDRARLLTLAGLGTLWIWLVPQGEVWMFAQTVATTALTLALVLTWRRQWMWAGLAFGFAITSRPPTLLALPLFVEILWVRLSGGPETARPQRARFRALATMALFPLLVGVAQLSLNDARFGSPLDFGYRYQLTPPELRERVDSYGSLSPAYFVRNVRYQLLQPPVVVRNRDTATPTFPILVSDPQGMGVFFVTPAFLLAFFSFHRQWRVPGLLYAYWLSLALVTTPALLFFNTGWVQWGGRYLLDAWPLWLVLTALGMQRVDSRVSGLLIALSVASNVWAAVLLAGGWWP
jgi:hypothetical protein